MGVDSTALLVGMKERGLVPDLILFADVGSEKPATYAYLPVIDRWLRQVKFPPVTVVRYQPRDFKNWPEYHTLEENCLTNGTLPSMAFGYGACSQKWKAAPQDRFLKGWRPALAAWLSGGRVTTAIGYDCSPRDKVRRTYADRATKRQHLYTYWYPLHEWGWAREECASAIRRSGLSVPPKSACFFCPATKPEELHELPPEHLKRIVLMEARAKPRLRTVEGLWRTSTKKRPGAMTEYIRSSGLLPEEEIDRLEVAVPTEILGRNDAHAGGRVVESWPDFFERVLNPSSTERVDSSIDGAYGSSTTPAVRDGAA
jgi:hypothetical protein